MKKLFLYAFLFLFLRPVAAQVTCDPVFPVGTQMRENRAAATMRVVWPNTSRHAPAEAPSRSMSQCARTCSRVCR